MINLTPISKKIQTRLFEKIQALSREGFMDPLGAMMRDVSGHSHFTHEKLTNRTTFLRMTSGMEIPVVLVNGELGQMSQVAQGYDDIYGTRGPSITNTLREKLLGGLPSPISVDVVGEPNTFNKPMPGLKSADISFKGGVRALREATINWTCWSFDDINRLMPHFLTHGHNVLLEWAWVYDDKSLNNLPTLKDKDGSRRSAFENYAEIVDDNYGDFDFMMGMIKNFEFTTRDDGGFDCTTIITSVGTSIIDASTPNRSQMDQVTTYKVKKDENITDTLNKISTALTAGAGEDKSQDDLIEFDAGVTLKTFIANIDKFLEDHYFSSKKALDFTGLPFGVTDNAIIVTLDNTTYGRDGEVKVPTNNFVQWGWFEDNILSKFLSLVSDHRTNPFVTQFRSIERIVETKVGLGEAFDTDPYYESVRIKNHPKLETTDINKFILPGQLKVFIPPKRAEVDGAEVDKAFIGPAEVEVPKGAGDPFYIELLQEITTEKFDAFSTVNANPDPYPFTKDNYWLPGSAIKRASMAKKAGYGSYPEYVKAVPSSKKRKAFWDQIQTKPGTGDQGYLRNMLINTKVLKSAFGINEDGSFDVIESISVREALENMFAILNQDIRIWDFNIVQDETETSRSKIIDEQITSFDFDFKTRVDDKEKKSKSTKSVYVSYVGEVINQGVFFFPVWSNRSITKRQNITAKVPNAMALSVMYGANWDEISTLGQQPSEATSVEVSALAGMFKNYTSMNPNVDMKNLSLALKKDGFDKVGVNGNGRLSKDGGNVDIKAWLNKKENKSFLEQTYNSKIEHIYTQIKAHSSADITQELYKGGLTYIVGEGKKAEVLSVPFPLPDVLFESDPEMHANLIKKDSEHIEHSYVDLYTSKYNSTGRMKQAFISTVSGFVLGTGTYSRSKKPLLIPLDLELDIDGIGGIIPGNSFHSDYLPSRYQEESVFQIFDVNHKIDSSGWTVTLVGKMRSTAEKLTKSDARVSMQEIADSLIEAKKIWNAQKQKEHQEQIKAEAAARKAEKSIRKIKQAGTEKTMGGVQTMYE